MHRQFYILFFFFGMISTQNILGADYIDSSTKHLTRIKNQIQNLQINIKHDDIKRNQIQKDLQQNEFRISQLMQQLHETKKNLVTQKEELKSLLQQQNLTQQTLQQQQTNLANHLRLAYQLGEQDYLKMFFNQTDASQVNRMWMYYHYLIQSRLNTIHTMNITLNELNEDRKKIKEHTEELIKLQNELEQYNNQLHIVEHHHTDVLEQLNNDLQTKQQRLKNLIANKEVLEKVLSQIEAKKPAYTEPNPPPVKRYGKFPWPTAGKMIQSYGASIEQSELKSNGVIISAPAGRPVHAVASGRVVFANWMAGYGFLIIVDHGQGLMSIYGQNATLYKKEGDTIHAGDIIASVGKTGGTSQPGLYFALRHHGKPVDPSIWCA